MMKRSNKVGIYIDAIDVTMNGGFGLRYDILRKFATRDGCMATRMNVYLGLDSKRAAEDSSYKQKSNRFSEVLRDFEYKVVQRDLPQNENLTTDGMDKSILEMEMACDILSQASQMDRIILLTNQESFVYVVNVLQNMGKRVELIGFDDTPSRLKKMADMYISGYTIPGLLPIKTPYEWGTVGSRVRGVCYDFSHSDGYGFLRYLNKIDEFLWITDSRSSDSPYKTVFAHVSQFESDFDSSFLPSRELIFEFDLVKNEKGLVAQNIVLVSAP
ncbi:NYN domain-containing protein [Cyclonatronum proteinivorum]|uniref:NYN domain-containing protein n=1 Tax=Cyclonatronum proteinivorum TaxID=1457365 RepID=A0A345UG90_9BACT|nr:NYN domain-containing protein [Cyclonatronum proteinivorum]AXI99491.1 NYN domain-containing protein [Cyclonatronum proteinivorum]